jgi:hypothetical protein
MMRASLCKLDWFNQSSLPSSGYARPAFTDFAGKAEVNELEKIIGREQEKPNGS